MSYQNYEDALNKTTEEAKIERAEKFAATGITTRAFSWSEPGCQIHGTMYLIDDKPHRFDYYIWDGSPGQPFKKLEEVYGPLKIKSDDYYGNGHCSARFE